MIAHKVKQNNSDWEHLRLGIPTASEFDNVISGGTWKVRTGQTRRTYLIKKLTERITGRKPDDFSSWAMEQGQILERYALPWFEFTHDMPINRTIGFCTTDDGKLGCSPDGLIGEEGGIEIKCPQDHTHLEYLLDGVVPKEYLAQVHGGMLVTGRAWWIFLSYSRRFPALLIRVERDEVIMQQMRNALMEFSTQLDAMQAKLSTLIDQ